MKKKTLAKSLCAVIALAVMTSILASCAVGQWRIKNPDDYKLPTPTLLTFTATTRLERDADVSFGGKNYKLTLKVYDDEGKTFNLTAFHEHTYDPSSEEGTPAAAINDVPVLLGKGPGGGGGGTPAVDKTDTEDLEFSFNGTWTEEEGWGYTLSFSDANGPQVIHVNYNKQQGRHYFYFNLAGTVKNQAVSSSNILMEANDSSYARKLDANYAIYEEREASFVFHGISSLEEGGKAQSGTETMIYLVKDGSVSTDSVTGNTTTHTMGGTWTKEGNVITAVIGGQNYQSTYCATPGKEGYRIVYSNASCYCPVAEGVSWEDYSDLDFVA